MPDILTFKSSVRCHEALYNFWYLHPGKSDSNTTLVSNYSDWTGLLLTPTNPDDIAKKYSLDSYVVEVV